MYFLDFVKRGFYPTSTKSMSVGGSEKKEGRDFQIFHTLQSFAEIVEIFIVISNEK